MSGSDCQNTLLCSAQRLGGVGFIPLFASQGENRSNSHGDITRQDSLLVACVIPLNHRNAVKF